MKNGNFDSLTLEPPNPESPFATVAVNLIELKAIFFTRKHVMVKQFLEIFNTNLRDDAFILIVDNECLALKMYTSLIISITNSGNRAFYYL